MSKSITPKKVYVWFNDNNSNNGIIHDDELKVYGNFIMTTSMRKLNRLTKKYPESHFEEIKDIEDINDYEMGLDETYCKLIEVNGKIYKYRGWFYDENGNLGWGWIPIEEYNNYIEKCKKCHAWIHQHNMVYFHHEGTLCENCFENNYKMTECCADIFHEEKEHMSGYYSIWSELENEGITVCKNCLKEHGIKINKEKYLNDTEYHDEIYKQIKEKNIC